MFRLHTRLHNHFEIVVVAVVVVVLLNIVILVLMFVGFHIRLRCGQ